MTAVTETAATPTMSQAESAFTLEQAMAMVREQAGRIVDRRQPGPKLAAALARAQGEFTNISKDRAVDVTPKDGGKGYTFRYATLPAIMKVIRGPLAKHEISLLMYPAVHHKEGAALQYIEVRAYLTHSSGESIVGSIEIPFTDRAPQKLGIIISYCRRYLLNALLGIAQEDESDYDDQGIVDGPPPMAANLTPGSTLPRREAEKATAAKAASSPAPNPTPPPAPVPQADPTKPSGPAPTEDDFQLQFDEAKTEPELTRIGADINEVKHTLTIEAQARLTAKFKARREAIRAKATGK